MSAMKTNKRDHFDWLAERSAKRAWTRKELSPLVTILPTPRAAALLRRYEAVIVEVIEQRLAVARARMFEMRFDIAGDTALAYEQACNDILTILKTLREEK